MSRHYLSVCCLVAAIGVLAQAQDRDKPNAAENVEQAEQQQALEGLKRARVDAAAAIAEAEAAADVEESKADAAEQAEEIEEPAAAAGPEIELFALEMATGKAQPVAAFKGYPVINSPEISPDGKWIAVDGWKHGEDLDDAKLLFINLETGKGRSLGYGAMPNWSADGRYIGVSKYGTHGTGRGVYVRSFDSTTERLIDTDGWGIQFSPDGMKVAYSVAGNIVVHNFISNEKFRVFPDASSVYSYILHNMTWSPDSKRICFIGNRRDGGAQEIATVSALGDRPDLQVVADAKPYNPDIAWHPDGSKIALPRAGAPGKPSQIDVLDVTGKNPATALEGQPTDRNNLGLCWSRDGEYLYFVSFK